MHVCVCVYVCVPVCACVCVCVYECACAGVSVHDASTSALHTSPHETWLLEQPSNGRAFAISSSCVKFVCRIRAHNYIRAFRAYINSRACVVSHTRMCFYFSCACVRLSSSSTYLHTRVAGVSGVDIAATAVDFFFALFLVVDSLFFVSRLEFHCLRERVSEKERMGVCVCASECMSTSEFLCMRKNVSACACVCVSECKRLCASSFTACTLYACV